MRDLMLSLGMLFYVPASLLHPAAGLLCSEWFSIMSPQQEVYGFLSSKPLNSVVAIATMIGWLISRERKKWTPDLLPWLLFLFFVWMTWNCTASPLPNIAWDYWDRTARILIPVFLVFFLMTNKARIHGMIWTIVISLGFYGVKGGVFTLATGGRSIVFGPPDSVIADNNQLALAIVMSLPLLYYLYRQSQLRLIRLGVLAALGLEILMVFGSYSRGGVIAMSVLLFLVWWRSERKIVTGLIGVILVGASLLVMPDSFWVRLHTISHPGRDVSFEGRVTAWHVAWDYATAHFPFGAGFYVPQQPTIFHHFYPGAVAHAAHSIYFQVLGEHGFIGLAIYLVILWLGIRNATIVVRRTRRVAELAWAHDLADSIRLALIGFYVGAAALSVAYFDGYLILLALTSTLRELVTRSLAQSPASATLPEQPGTMSPVPAARSQRRADMAETP